MSHCTPDITSFISGSLALDAWHGSLKGGSSSSGSWMGGVLEALLTVASRVLLNRVAIRGLGI